jgi:hypothetical protein
MYKQRQGFLLRSEGGEKVFQGNISPSLTYGKGEEYFLSAGLLQECKRKSRQAKLQFTIKKGSSFKAFE